MTARLKELWEIKSVLVVEKERLLDKECETSHLKAFVSWNLNDRALRMTKKLGNQVNVTRHEIRKKFKEKDIRKKKVIHLKTDEYPHLADKREIDYKRCRNQLLKAMRLRIPVYFLDEFSINPGHCQETAWS